MRLDLLRGVAVRRIGLAALLAVGMAHGAVAQTVGGGAASSGTVTVGTALPAGSNTIGTVNLGTVPSLTIGSSALPSGAATSALQSAIESAPGTSQTQAITIQGNASGISVPVSGSVSATQSGTWNIGSITTLPNITIGAALPAGSNAIGSVSLNAALPAGSNTIGNIGSIATLPNITIGAALPAGSNTIGTVGLSPVTGTPTETTGTCGTTSGTVLAANAANNFEIFDNPSTSGATVWLNFAGAAATTAAPSKDLVPGQQISWQAAGGGYLPTAAVTCIATASTTITVIYK